MDKGFNKSLTIVLIVLISSIVVVLTVIVVRSINAKRLTDDQADAVENFAISTGPTIISSGGTTHSNTNNTVQSTIDLNALNENDTDNTNGTGSTASASKISKHTYKGYTMLGTIRIPKTNLKLPVLAMVTKDSMEVSVGVAYGPGLNQVGNTVILGHNYRNNTFFSNNKKLVVGDSVFIKDTSGTEIEYKIYDIQVLSADDFDYASRDTQGKREISLSTCTDDVANRLVIFAREKE